MQLVMRLLQTFHSHKHLFYFSPVSGISLWMKQDHQAYPFSTCLAEMPKYPPTLELHSKWYPKWEANKFYFRGKKKDCSSADTFVVMLPPPNVTGTLHMGHALSIALQDTLVRWHGMLGCNVLWVPGCDHAGIATQVVVEKHLKQTTGVTRQQLGRDKFVEEVWRWKAAKEERIYQQLRQMGAALDWDRAVFTMDEGMSSSVVHAFITLYDRGLIYRGVRTVNYCPALRSVISDIEVDTVRLSGPTSLIVPGHDAPVTFGRIYDIAYSLVLDEGGTAAAGETVIVVSTTRPETIPGDTAVMVHPSDQRYAHLVGRRVVNPCRPDHTMPVIADTAVDISVGTGAVKVTPGVSDVDYEVGLRHGLPCVEVFSEEGCMGGLVTSLKGLPRFEGREAIVSELQGRGAVRDVRPHAMTLPLCSRTGDVLETRACSQWFVRVEEMAGRAVQAVEDGELNLRPHAQRGSWMDWLGQNRTKDWCVSRQIWWGHRVPMYRVWAPGAEEHEWLAAESLDQALQLAADKHGVEVRVEQDTDVLDTWFSSALFPFAALGWPQQTKALAQYYPTSVLVTGMDILYFWVARMVMLGTELTGQLPFKSVQVHGLVCDGSGDKMSKSKGNAVDPLELIGGTGPGSHQEPVGADALRMALLSQDLKCERVSVTRDLVEPHRTLQNKMWQAVRFLRQAHDSLHQHQLLPLQHLRPVHELPVLERWLLHQTHHLVHTANAALADTRVHLLVEAFVTFWKSHFCGIYVEAIKPTIYRCSGSECANSAVCSLSVGVHCARIAVQCIAPVMPYITEELYQALPPLRGITLHPSVMAEQYPLPEHLSQYRDDGVASAMEAWQAVITAFRSVRKDYNVYNKGFDGSVYSSDERITEAFPQMAALATHATKLAHLQVVRVAGDSSSDMMRPPVASLSHAVDSNTVVHLHVQGGFDADREVERLHKRLTKLSKQLMQLQKRKKSREQVAACGGEMQRVQHLITSLQSLNAPSAAND